MQLSAFLLTVSLLFNFTLSSCGQHEDMSHIKLATTTTTDNSGLLAELIPVFEERNSIKVDVIAVGTGKAIIHGKNGDVDVILVHARNQEDAFIDSGFGIDRRDVMHNDFILIGPDSDPSGIRGSSSATEALKSIAEYESSFLSRGDDSGTHTKERQLWKDTDITPSGQWYKEAGQGMGTVLTMSNEMLAYTMTDRGTWLAMKDKLDLVLLFEGDPILYNPYGVIAVNPERHDHVNYEDAMRFISFLTSQTGQNIIQSYRKNGEQLFFPDALN